MKVQIFSGRVHHWLKLRNIYHELEERGHETEFVVANNAINIDPASQYLMNSGYKWQSVYPYIHDISASEFSFSGDWPYKALSNVPPFWWYFSLTEMKEFATGITSMWKANGLPDAVLVLHENNFWTKLLAWLCKENGIPCYSFQEGLLRHRDQKTMNKQAMAAEYSSGLFVWTESDRDSYINAGVDEGKIHVVGCSHLDRKYLPARSSSSSPIVLLALPSFDEYVGDMFDDVQAISNYCDANNLKLIVRVHPFEKNLALSFPKDITFDLNDDVLPTLVSARVVLGQHSTVMLEAILLGIPIVEYNFSNKELTEPLYKNGVADYATKYSLDVIKNIIQYGISNVSVDSINKLRVDLNGANSKIVDVLEANND